MSSTPALHYVCTHEEALGLVADREELWVSNCGCREGRGGCARSRMDLCLMFGDMPASGSGKKRTTRAEVEEIFQEAAAARLVARPFRSEDRTATDGICFCCDDCCGYFLNPSEKCDQGVLVEETAMERCTHCGACEEICRFHARAMRGGKLEIERENCYGCGLCVDECPEACISMVPRAAGRGWQR